MEYHLYSSDGPFSGFYTDFIPACPRQFLPPDMAFMSCLPTAATWDASLGLHGRYPADSLTGVSLADINPFDPAGTSQETWTGSPHVADFLSPLQERYPGADSQSPASLDGADANASQPLFNPSSCSGQSPGMAGSPSMRSATPSHGEGESQHSPAAETDRPDAASPMWDADANDPFRPRHSLKKRPAPTRSLDQGPPKRRRAGAPATPPATSLPSSTGANTDSIALTCRECSVCFQDETLLQAHIKKQHTRPFICVFGFAGCPSTFASKNEWKRHVMSQHLVLFYWLCDLDDCAHKKNGPSAAAAKSNSGRHSRSARRPSERLLTLGQPIGPPLPNGVIFNRKDLYTQHWRRMHAPPHVKKASKACASKGHGPANAEVDWKDMMASNQSRARRTRCELPEHMQCPASHCDLVFSGADAWDQRMEHVAKHLEKASVGDEDPVVFGGPTDPSLMEWVTRPDVAVVRNVGGGKWALNNLLRSATEGRGVGRRRDVGAKSSTMVSQTAAAVVSMPQTMSTLSFSTKTPAVVAPLGDAEVAVDEGEVDAEGEEWPLAG